MNDAPKDAGDQTYRAGDAVAVAVGEIKLADGRTIKGVVLEFPVAPPDDLTFADVWRGTPLRLTRTAI